MNIFVNLHVLLYYVRAAIAFSGRDETPKHKKKTIMSVTSRYVSFKLFPISCGKQLSVV